MAEQKQPKIEFRIENIERISCFENDLNELNVNKDKIGMGNVNIIIRMHVNEKSNLLKFDTNVTFSHIKKNINIDLFGIKTSHIFEINNMSNIFPRDDKNKLIFPEDFLQTLLALIIGSIRGMLVVSITNKDYKGIYLPVVNLKELLKAILPQEN